MASDLQRLLAEAERQGWRVKQTKKGHWMAYPPGKGDIVAVPGTPGDSRSLKNAIALMRRSGFEWEGH